MPIYYATGLASDLQLFPMKDVIYSDYRLDQFDEGASLKIFFFFF